MFTALYSALIRERTCCHDLKHNIHIYIVNDIDINKKGSKLNACLHNFYKIPNATRKSNPEASITVIKLF